MSSTSVFSHSELELRRETVRGFLVCRTPTGGMSYTVPITVPAAENNTRVGLARSMASAGTRSYNGGLGAEPPAGVQGAEPRGARGQSPLKLMAF